MGTHSVPLGDDRLDMTIEGDDFGLDANFFDEFPSERGGHCLADFDAPAGQAEMAEQWRPRPADDEHLPSRNTAADTARMGRAGNKPVIHGSSPAPRPSIWSGNRSGWPCAGGLRYPGA
jgi:hypothetical protein